ncbi:MAG: hypothetical protein IPH86_12850 [bacterium]|nr:hypothetical protein [bacterium]
MASWRCGNRGWRTRDAVERARSSHVDAHEPAFATKILAFRTARSWRPFYTPTDLDLAFNIEAGELAELIPWKTEAEATGMAANPAKRTAIAHELGDFTIYVLHPPTTTASTGARPTWQARE